MYNRFIISKIFIKLGLLFKIYKLYVLFNEMLLYYLICILYYYFFVIVKDLK